jgi:SAM-dependent methyltransferase
MMSTYNGTQAPSLRQIVTRAAKAILPRRVRRPLAAGVSWLDAQPRRFRCRPPLGWIRFGDLRRTEPFDRNFGWGRGAVIDRYYIERFLHEHAADVQGRVLEIGDDQYTKRFGGTRVHTSDVLHVRDGNPHATMVADLTRGDSLPSNAFDCIILTQTLQCIYDVRAAISTVERILRPGGVVLATGHGISQISRGDMDQWGEYWRFTTQSMRQLFEEVFPPQQIEIGVYGNVLAAAAALYGVAAEELTPEELQHQDPDYELLITVRAVKPKARQ